MNSEVVSSPQQECLSKKNFDTKTRRLLYTIGELYGYVPTDTDVEEFQKEQIAKGHYIIIEDEKC